MEDKKREVPAFMPTFVAGAKKGWNTVINVVLPNIIFAHVITMMLQLSGLMDVIGKVISPVMGIFGLPGEAGIAIAIALTSLAAGVSSTASLVATGVLTGAHAFILFPIVYLMGSWPTFTARIMSVTGLENKYYKLVYGISLVVGIASMYIMNILLKL